MAGGPGLTIWCDVPSVKKFKRVSSFTHLSQISSISADLPSFVGAVVFFGIVLGGACCFGMGGCGYPRRTVPGPNRPGRPPPKKTDLPSMSAPSENHV